MINRIAECALALLACYWGIILMLPGDLFAGIERYKYYSRYAPDTIWGAVMAVCGIFILLNWPRQARMPAHLVLSAVWFGMGILSLLPARNVASTLIAALAFSNSLIHATKFWKLQIIGRYSLPSDGAG